MKGHIIEPADIFVSVLLPRDTPPLHVKNTTLPQKKHVRTVVEVNPIVINLHPLHVQLLKELADGFINGLPESPAPSVGYPTHSNFALEERKDEGKEEEKGKEKEKEKEKSENEDEMQEEVRSVPSLVFGGSRQGDLEYTEDFKGYMIAKKPNTRPTVCNFLRFYQKRQFKKNQN